MPAGVKPHRRSSCGKFSPYRDDRQGCKARDGELECRRSNHEKHESSRKEDDGLVLSYAQQKISQPVPSVVVFKLRPFG
jgi:hypothetical protein